MFRARGRIGGIGKIGVMGWCLVGLCLGGLGVASGEEAAPREVVSPATPLGMTPADGALAVTEATPSLPEIGIPPDQWPAGLERVPFTPSKEISELQNRAFSGNERAKIELAVRTFYGEGVPIDYDIAVSYCRETEHPIARFVLSRAFLHGVGVPQQIPNARHLEAEVLPDLERLASEGDGLAHYCLGHAALAQDPSDPATAAVHFERAIQGQCPLGIAGLGALLIHGKTSAEIQSGFKLLHQAVPFQSAAASRWLAVFFRKRGDWEKEKAHLQMAVRLQEPASMIELGLLCMDQGEPQKGAALFERALQIWSTSPEALTMMAFCFYRGTGVAQDYEKALDLARRATAEGSADACILLAWLYQSGLAVPKDVASAYRWCLLGIARGSHHPSSLRLRDRLELELSREQAVEIQGQLQAGRPPPSLRSPGQTRPLLSRVPPPNAEFFTSHRSPRKRVCGSPGLHQRDKAQGG